MGVQKSKQKKLTFVKMKEGKFFIKDDPEPYDEVEGYLTDIGTEWAEFEQGKKTKVLYLLLEDGNGAFKLTFNWDSIATTNLVKFLKSADLSKELAIVPALKEVDGVKKRSIFVRQNGSTLKAFYSKDHPNGLPQLKQTKFKGELKWDNGEQLDFLENVVNEDLRLQLNGVPKTKEAIVVDDQKSGLPWDKKEENEQTDVDDLPF